MCRKEVIVSTLLVLAMTLNFTYLYLSMAFLKQSHAIFFVIMLSINAMVLVLFYRENKQLAESNLFAYALSINIQLWAATIFYVANAFLSIITVLIVGAFLSNIILLMVYIKEKNS